MINKNLTKLINKLIEQEVDQAESPINLSRTNALTKTFGDPMITSCLLVDDVIDWIDRRRAKLDAGTKFAVIKITDDTFGIFDKSKDNKDKYLVILNMDELMTENRITDSILIKYETIDRDLNDRLEKGNGLYIITK